jgi:hypothetical protein
MKYATNRPYSDPNRLRAASWSTLRPPNPSREGRIYIEKINGPFLFGDKGTPAEYSAGLDLAIKRGWLTLHESGTYAKFTQSGASTVRLMARWRRALYFSCSARNTGAFNLVLFPEMHRMRGFLIAAGFLCAVRFDALAILRCVYRK